MEKMYNLTTPQKSILLTEQFYSGTNINNICGTAIIENKLDFDLLVKAINIVAKNNDSFNFKLVLENNEMYQYLDNFNPLDIEIVDISSKKDVAAIENTAMSHVFDIYNNLLFEFKIFRFKDNSGGFLLNIHHLFADSWTLGLTVKDIVRVYSCLINNLPVEKDNDFSYVDYIYSEKEYVNSDKFIKDKEYWDNIYSTIPESASIPSINSNLTTTVSCLANREIFCLDKDLLNKINMFCKDTSISVFNFFMAVYSIYLSRVTNLDDFVIGTPILNRTNFKEKNTTGMFINIAPLRINIDNSIDFKSFASNIAKDCLGMLRHQKYSYQYILENLRKKDPTLPSLYNMILSYQVTKANTEKGLSYETRWAFNGTTADDIDVHLYDINDSGSINIAYDYKVNKYTSEDISNIHNRILYIINQILCNLNICLSDIKIVTPSEKYELLYNFNNTDLEYDENIPLISFFEKQSNDFPESIALTFEGIDMSYKILNEHANSLAYVLRENGVLNNSIVGIMVNRSFEMIISILAVLKAGGAYLPIDPEYPEERINYMLSDSKTSMLLTQKNLDKKINCEKTIYVDLDSSIYDNNKSNLNNISKPEDLSYIIYTSGSTGKPKGVMLTQKNFSNFYAAMLDKIEYLSFEKKYSIVSITTVSFDIFGFETLISLTNGLHLFITNYFEQKLTNKLEKLICDGNIDIIQTTPSVMRFHLDNLTDISNFSNLKYVILAGEQLPVDLVRRIKKIAPSCIVYNGYGPSETTIFSSVQDVTNLEKINIGKPISNTQIYILDKNMNLLPKYHVGEIYISGDGVGKGYLYKQDLTNKGFLHNSFNTNSLLYKTGDLGQWTDNGFIECKGRIDHQVKLRGLRIELGEIENKINSFTMDNSIKSAVIVKHEPDKDYLCGFIECINEIDISKLKEYLLKLLPNYMIPTYFIQIDKLPQTPNGKTDRKALNLYEIASINKVLVAPVLPRNEIEKILVNSISAKLNTENFGIDNNIFECGADSLCIINILTDLFKYDFNLNVHDFYKYPTVRELYDNLLTENDIKKVLDVDKYIKINNIVKSFNISTDCKAINKRYNILLTGSTGFLGIHILSELLNNYNIDTIYCTIRSKNNTASSSRLIDKLHFYFGTIYDCFINTKIKIIDADITKKNLNLKDKIFEELKDSIDLVIHSAANVKHYGNYSEFEVTNITGTQNIITFCKEANCPLHYMSTMTVSGNYLLKQSNNNIIFDETSFYNNQQFDNNVYAKSKLIAETIVLEAISSGINCTIYRVGDLTGRFSDGTFQQNIYENAIYLRLKSILEIGVMSEAILDNLLEFTPIDYAAGAICKIIWSDNNKNRIYNIYNPNMITTKSLLNFINTCGYSVTIANQKDFMNYVKKLSESSTNQSKISGIINDFTSDNDFIYNYTIKTDNLITCSYLKNLNFIWPTLSFDYIKNLLSYMKSTNFIK